MAGRAALFAGRLHWHCHFIQKLESEPEIEHRDLHPAYTGLRGFDERRHEAWARGYTGLPFVDACMRSLAATGWINFRMRAMLVSVSSYHLWNDWREPGLHLARLFTDYEPGIHWSQTQMQSGTTGINTARIYNPVKQGLDHDPAGTFVRRWVPELAQVPTPFIHAPWKLSPLERRDLALAYPDPVVEPVTAAREARARIWGVRGTRPSGRRRTRFRIAMAAEKAACPSPDPVGGARRRTTARRASTSDRPALETSRGPSQTNAPHQDLRRVRPAVRLAPEMGTGLGERALLLGPLPAGAWPVACRTGQELA